ncbi:hypothetical protein EYF80_034256 [Liparis tanakae]|uniref:Uncharacterized protein n=1 Tax=Liparis tanakae TaxID=230148 RepID=A0A4Z2GS59_9TELE|nr:hypothetical protein EYF80_034256 [Liparis tanakae]
MNELHTGDSFDVGDIEIPTSGQRSEECGYVRGALEAFSGLLVALPVVDLQDVGGHRGPLGPAVRRALQHVVFDQVLLVAVVREDHRLSFGVAAEHHVGVEDAADLPEEGRRAVLQLLGGDVDHQDQVAVGELLRHVVGAVQTVPFAFCVVAALVTVTVGVVVFTVLVIQRAGGKGGYWRQHCKAAEQFCHGSSKLSEQSPPSQPQAWLLHSESQMWFPAHSSH